MAKNPNAEQRPEQVPREEPPPVPEPRWLVIVAFLAVGGIYLALPPWLSVGPAWLLLAIVVALEVPAIISHRLGYARVNRMLGHIASSITTVFMLISIAMLLRSLAHHAEPPLALLRSAAALWVTNVIVFASWYWRLDAGGPHGRDARAGHPEGAFLFPQMTLREPQRDGHGRLWSPQFIDYLFLAFNTSAAFSPTDSPVLSRWAKVLMMIQASISLTTVALLFGRAVNII